MKVDHGIVTESEILSDGNEFGKIIKVYKGVEVGRYKFFRVQKKVNNQKEEAAYYLKFSQEMNAKRSIGQLASLKDDEHRPQWRIIFPKTNVDGSYIVETYWVENET